MIRPQTAPDRLGVQSLVAGLVQEAGEEVVGIGAECHGKCFTSLQLVARRPRDPTGEREGRRGVLAVRSDAAAGQRPPEPEGGTGLVALHPLGRAVASRAVLQAQNEPRGLVVPEQFVVAAIRGGSPGHGRSRGEPVHELLGQPQRLLCHTRTCRVVQDPGDQRHTDGVQGYFLLQGDRGLQGQQPGLELSQRPTYLKSGVRRRGGQHGRTGQAHRPALGRAALHLVAAERPEPAVGDAQGLDHRHVEAAACDAHLLGQRTQPFHDLSSGLAWWRLLAEEGNHLLGAGAPALAAPHQAVGQLPGGRLPVVRARGDAEPCPTAEPAAAVPFVQGYEDDAVLRAVPEEVGQGIGQLGRRTQSDLVLGGMPVVCGAVELVRGP